jgi:hypothetical protein
MTITVFWDVSGLIETHQLRRNILPTFRCRVIIPEDTNLLIIFDQIKLFGDFGISVPSEKIKGHRPILVKLKKIF